jgi:hypothetical protein
VNTSRLAKHYGSLSVVERLRLIHDAGRRGDAIEQQRVREASPRRHYSMLDTGRLENNLRTCWTTYITFQLGTLAEFWYAEAMAVANCALGDVADNEPIPDEAHVWCCSATLAETIFAVERDGWNLFIRQSGVDESRITSRNSPSIPCSFS